MLKFILLKVLFMASAKTISFQSDKTTWTIGQSLPGGNYAVQNLQYNYLSDPNSPFNQITGNAIWYKQDNTIPYDYCFFKKFFSIPKTALSGILFYVADDIADITLNGNYIDQCSHIGQIRLFYCNITQYLVPLVNILEIRVENTVFMCGLSYNVTIQT